MARIRWSRIKDRIAQRTGLTLDDEIEAYALFCDHATGSQRPAPILEGDVEAGFYARCKAAVTPAERDAEDEVWRGYWNNRLRHGMPIPTTPITRQARAMLEWYRALFVEKGLISGPQQLGRWAQPYRVLLGYQYWDDSEFYTKSVTDGGVSYVTVK